MNSDWESKIAALRSIAERHGLDAVVLRDPLNLAWLTEARWHVPHTLDTACFDAVVEGLSGRSPGVRIVANQIEVPRLRDTELAGLPLEYDVVPWDEDRTTRLPTGSDAGWDRPIGNLPSRDIAQEMTDTRRLLTLGQQRSLRELSSDAAAIVGRVAAAVRPGDTEHEVAARVLSAFAERGIEIVALFVAADDRGDAHRHPLPTAKVIERQVMIACCSRRDGVVASTTRFAAFGLTISEEASYRALLEVEAGFLNASMPGRPLGEIFEDGVRGYAQHGFASDEWRRHHQGGVTGFSPRELIVHSATKTPLRAGMALAWNPSASGFKIEDSALVSASGLEVFGADPEWPTIRVAGRDRPAILQL